MHVNPQSRAGLRGLVFLVLLAVGCSSSSSPTAPATGGPSGTGGAGGTSGTATFSAVIDGQSWAATGTTLTASYIGGILAVAGTDTTGRTFSIGLGVSQPGIYTLGAPAFANANYVAAGQSWNASSVDGGAGSVTVTAVSASAAAGTFSYTLVPNPGSGASGMKTVAQGVFNVRY